MLDLCNLFAGPIINTHKRLNISDHNQTLFFLYPPFANVYLETIIISVREIFTEL